MKRISAILLIAIVTFAFNAGAMAQNRILKIMQGGKVVYSECVADIDYITMDVEYVDLGLPSGTKWASCNLGANTPEEYGNYYGWGCTTPYKDTDDVNWELYFKTLGGSGTDWPDCGTDKDPLKDYVKNRRNISGTEWDVAKLGRTWRIPTKAEFQELVDNCNWTKTTLNGVRGYRLTSKTNGNSIFLPSADFRTGETTMMVGGTYYWSATPYDNITNDEYDVAMWTNFVSDVHFEFSAGTRCLGLPIRPVYDPEGEYVDLGLPTGTKWASCNLGASKIDEYGDYYAWGCTEPYTSPDDANWTNYFQLLGGSGTSEGDCGTDKDPMRMYVGNKISITGTKWDVAHAKLGGNCRMPNNNELLELLNTDNCTWTWISINGVAGCKVTSKKNGKYIFLPAAGFYYSGLPTYEGGDGYYWLSTPDEADDTDFAGILQINDEQHFDRRSNSRFIGMTIRPVLAPVPEPEVEYVDLALPSGTKWATCNLGASSPEDHGDYYGWGCTEPYKDTDYVYWPLYFQNLGGTGTSKEDCGTDADPLKDYELNMKSIAGTEWDAVHLDIGGKWHIPTEDEFLELLNTDNCSCTWDSEKYGYTVTSKKNGNSIFLPAAGSRDRTSSSLYGIGHYWSSTPAERYNFGACDFTFDPDYDWSATSNNRYEGMPIRPVSK